MKPNRKETLVKISVCLGYGAAFTVLMALFQYVYNLVNDEALALPSIWFGISFIGGSLLGAYLMWSGQLKTDSPD